MDKNSKMFDVSQHMIYYLSIRVEKPLGNIKPWNMFFLDKEPFNDSTKVNFKVRNIPSLVSQISTRKIMPWEQLISELMGDYNCNLGAAK